MKEKIFHMNVKVFSRKKGHNFFQKLAYRDGTKYNDERTGQTFNYERRQHEVETIFQTPEGTSEELKDRKNYYEILHKKENRKDSQLYREIEISLFRGLSKEENIELAKRFAKQFNDNEKLITDLNFHKLDSGNPHVHILLPLRPLDENGQLGKKIQKHPSEARKDLVEWRKRWEQTANQYFKELGKDFFISSESNKTRGLNRKTQKHLPVNKKSKKYEATKAYNQLVKKVNLTNEMKSDMGVLKKQKKKKRIQSSLNFKRDSAKRKKRKQHKALFTEIIEPKIEKKPLTNSAALNKNNKKHRRDNGFSL